MMPTTQDLYQKALKYAGEMHANQKVPGTNANYLLHISNVAMEVIFAHKFKSDFDLDYAVQLAILHDIIEDTHISQNELTSEFGKKVAEGVMALTKNDSLPTKTEQIIDSLHRINLMVKEVGIVKLADRITNLQEPPVNWDLKKRQNYLEDAKVISKMLQGKNEYLNKRLEEKIKDYNKYFIT